MSTTSVDVTLTARSKSFRYLSQPILREHVLDPQEVFYDPESGRYMVRVERWKQVSPTHSERETLAIVTAYEDGDVTVITQTGDHYDWDDFERLDLAPWER